MSSRTACRWSLAVASGERSGHTPKEGPQLSPGAIAASIPAKWAPEAGSMTNMEIRVRRAGGRADSNPCARARMPRRSRGSLAPLTPSSPSCNNWARWRPEVTCAKRASSTTQVMSDVVNMSRNSEPARSIARSTPSVDWSCQRSIAGWPGASWTVARTSADPKKHDHSRPRMHECKVHLATPTVAKMRCARSKTLDPSATTRAKRHR